MRYSELENPHIRLHGPQHRPNHRRHLLALCLLVGIAADCTLALGQGAVEPDTMRILVRHLSLPNMAACDSFDDDGVPWILPDGRYDTIIEADDGSAVRWGCLYRSTPDEPFFNANGGYATRTAEDNRPHPIYTTLLAFNIGCLPSGCRIENAHIALNEQRFGTDVDLSTGYIAARLDTVAADYAVIGCGSGDTGDGSDRCFLDAGYLYTDTARGTRWAPPLSARDDWHDFGPSSGRLRPTGAINNMGTLKIDVTDALQQLVDRGNPFSGWALFWVHPTGTPIGIISFMFGDGPLQCPGGNPALSITCSSERGDRPWGAVHVPIVVGVDDGHEIHARYRDIFAAAGKRYTEFAPYSAFQSIGGALLGPAQRDSINETALVDLALHTRTHTGFGTIDDDHRLDYELARDWVLDAFTDPRDTTTLVDFAWAGAGADTANYSIQGVSRIIANGYRSARTATATWSRSLGAMTPLGLDNYANMYAIPAMNWSAIFGRAATPFTVATMRDTLMDYIDMAWTDQGRAPLVIYGHAGQPNENGTYEMVHALVERVGELPGVDFMGFGDAVAWRRSGQSAVPPMYVMNDIGAPQKIRTSAAMYDSVLATDGDMGMLSVWLPPYDSASNPRVSAVSPHGQPCGRYISALTAAPNPFNPVVVVRYSLPRNLPTRIDFFDLRGRLIRHVFEGVGKRGENTVRWDGRDSQGNAVASGIYFCRISAGTESGTLKVTLVR